LVPSKFDRSKFAGRVIILDTCIVKSRGITGCDELIEFFGEVGATPAITSIVLQEIMHGYLFPLQEKLHILGLIGNHILKFLDLPPINNLIERISEDLRFPFWKGFIPENFKDYLIALTALENEAWVMTDNIAHFEAWRTRGLRCLTYSEVDTVRYG